jgi:NADH-quinone oxidoreductase subunit C
LSSADVTDAPADAPDEEAAPRDERRELVLAQFAEELGDALVGSHIRPGDDLWIRVTRDAWVTAAEVAHQKLGMRFFDFLSGLDWLPSPFGRELESQEDIVVHGRDPKDPVPMTTGYAGGDTRFQVFARVYSVTEHHGVTLKADLPDDDLSVGTWSSTFLGANWHERETHEMFGFTFVGHPWLANLYLPGEFEGYPLRKDFPLLSRRVKPWPGIVDVEPMPGEDDEAGEDGEGSSE